MTTILEGLQSLVNDAEEYLDLILLMEDNLNVEIKLTDLQESATLIINRKLSIINGSHKPDFRLTMTSNNFKKILAREADFGAQIGRSKITDTRPINIEILNKEKTNVIMNTLYTLMTVFFIPGKVKVKHLHEKLAGNAHGAHPIPLIYWDGIRFAWYVIKKGEVANEAGEMDPYPQAFLPLKGEGVIIIGNYSFEVELNKIVYVPPNKIHQIKANEDMEVLWIAWKTP